MEITPCVKRIEQEKCVRKEVGVDDKQDKMYTHFADSASKGTYLCWYL